MTDFLITEMTFYPWFTILVVVLAIGGVAWWAVLLGHGVAWLSDWVAYRRAVLHWKTAVRRVGDGGDRLCPVHALEAEKVTGTDHLLEDDPPEYQHPDGDDELAEWEADTAADEQWGQDMADLAEVLRVAHERGYLDDVDLRRCYNVDCSLVGVLHNGPCQLEDAWLDAHLRPDPEPPDEEPPDYRDGAAMPPQPVREFLHPAIMDSLEQAGFSEHETTDGAVDSIYTRAMAREVEAMVTDGIIPADKTERSQ